MGKHLILDIHCENKKLMENKKVIANLLNECVSLIKMNKLNEPIIFDGADYNKGVTGFVVIETSHISMHTFSDKNKIAFDLYSCKDYDENAITDYLLNKTQGEIINKVVLMRFDE